MKTILSILLLLATNMLSFAQTGINDPVFKQADSLVMQFLKTYNIPGATIALAKDGKMVYNRGFGYSDLQHTTPTQPNQLFRIASLSKQITAITIMKMMQDSGLHLNDKVFGPGGILQFHPDFIHANISDKRIYDITVQQLLEHSAGWDRDSKCNPNPTLPYSRYINNCDPISIPLRVAMFTGASNPVSKHAMGRYILEKGLDFAPGTKYSYSNMGYLLLGEMIEHLSGLSYEAYVQQYILHPLGIYDMHLAKNLLSDKQEREVEYTGNGYKTLSCYNTGALVPWEYGGFNLEAMDAYGGWITTAGDLLKLLVAVDGFSTKPDILNAETIHTMVTPSVTNPFYAKGWFVSSNGNWWHTGSIDGTACEQVRSNNGYTWVILLNKRLVSNNDFWRALDNLGWSCLPTVSNWPAYDLLNTPTMNASDIRFTNKTSSSVTVKWTKGNGDGYLLLVSPDSAFRSFPVDGNDYVANLVYGKSKLPASNQTIAYNGQGNNITIKKLSPGKTYYYRVITYNKNISTGDHSLHLLGNNPVAKLRQPGAIRAIPNPVKRDDYKTVKTGMSTTQKLLAMLKAGK